MCCNLSNKNISTKSFKIRWNEETTKSSKRITESDRSHKVLRQRDMKRKFLKIYFFDLKFRSWNTLFLRDQILDKVSIKTTFEKCEERKEKFIVWQASIFMNKLWCSSQLLSLRLSKKLIWNLERATFTFTSKLN